jgi:tetratricopeptide (TPR) repeat protein/DNA-binding SARP family transcriptional activator
VEPPRAASTRLKVLGPLELFDGDRPVKLRPAGRTLLAALYLDDAPVSVTTLLQLLNLPDDKPRRATLRSHIRTLNQSLDSVGAADRAPGRAQDGPIRVVSERSLEYRLVLDRDAVFVDRDEFLRLADEGLQWLNAGADASALEALDRAAALWRSEPLPELAGRPDAMRSVQDLNKTYHQVRMRRAHVAVALGLVGDLSAELAALTAQRPDLPWLWADWARTVFREGDTTEAAEICRKGVKALIAAGSDVAELYNVQERVLNEDPSLRTAPTATTASAGALGEPPLEAELIGRADDLHRVDDLLRSRPGNRMPPAVVLHGPAGVGKSQLALHYWLTVRRPDDILLWIPSGSTTTARTALEACARSLGVPKDVPADDLLGELWARLQLRGNWMLVFDNAEAEGIAEYWPRADTGRVLVTTTTHRQSALAATYQVLPLEPPEAIRYLARFDPIGDGPAIAEIARRLGGVPGALEAAVAAFKGGTTPARYVEVLADRQLGPGTAAQLSSWSPAIEQLAAESPATAQLASLLSFFDIAPFPLDVLAERTELFPALLAEALRDRQSTAAMLDLLSSRLAVTATADNLIGPHELIRKAIGKRLRDTGERAHWLSVAVRVLDSAVIEPAHRNALYPHAVVVSRLAQDERIESAAVVRLLLFAGRYAASLGEMDDAVQAFNAAWHVCNSTPDDEAANAPDAADVLQGLAMQLRNQGALDKAEQAARQALALHAERGTQGSGSAAEAQALLGVIWFDQGRFLEANTTLTEAAATQSALSDGVSDEQRRLTLAVRGLVLWRLQELPAARAAAEEALRLAGRIHGTDSAVYATGLDNLVKVLLDQGDLDEALEAARQARELRSTRLGSHHPFTALAGYHLARVLRVRASARELGEARILCRRALHILRDRLGAKHGHVARCLEELGLVELRRGNARAAADLLAEANRLFMECLGISHYETALCGGHQAMALMAAGDEAAALATARNSYRLLAVSRQFSATHPYMTALRSILYDEIA